MNKERSCQYVVYDEPATKEAFKRGIKQHICRAVASEIALNRITQIKFYFCMSHLRIFVKNNWQDDNIVYKDFKWWRRAVLDYKNNIIFTSKELIAAKHPVRKTTQMPIVDDRSFEKIVSNPTVSSGERCLSWNEDKHVYVCNEAKHWPRARFDTIHPDGHGKSTIRESDINPDGTITPKVHTRVKSGNSKSYVKGVSCGRGNHDYQDKGTRWLCSVCHSTKTKPKVQ